MVTNWRVVGTAWVIGGGLALGPGCSTNSQETSIDGGALPSTDASVDAVAPGNDAAADSDAPPRSNAKIVIRLFGSIPEDLLPEMASLFDIAPAGAVAPLVGSIPDVASLSDSDRAAFAAALSGGVPIVLVRPSWSTIAAVRDLLGLGATPVATDPSLELWGFVRNPRGDVLEFAGALPAASQTTSTSRLASDGGVTDEETSGTFADDDAYQLDRLDALQEWLRDRLVNEIPTTETRDAKDGPPDIAQVVGADYATATFGYLRNVYTFNVSARSVFQAGNYFVISARGILNSIPEWEATTSESERNDDGKLNRGRIAHAYEVGFEVADIGPTAPEVSVVTKTYPQTVENVVEYSDTLSWELGGKATAGGECSQEKGCVGKVGFELTGGVKASLTKRFTVRDVKVLNRSSANAPSWSFTLPTPTAYFNGWSAVNLFLLCFREWTKPVDLAVATFQPEMAWVWKVDDAIRARFPAGLPVTVRFRPTLAHCYTRTCLAHTELLKSDELRARVVFPWPPKVVGP